MDTPGHNPDTGTVSLRAQMPQVAAWIDGLRAVFGRETVDGSIRAGLRGGDEGWRFWARENGREIGGPRL